MVWRGESDDVNVFVFEEFADVGVAFDLLASVLAFFDFFVQNIAIDVAKRDEPGALELAQALNVRLTSPVTGVKADDGEADVFVGPGGPRPHGGRQQAEGSRGEEGVS